MMMVQVWKALATVAICGCVLGAPRLGDAQSVSETQARVAFFEELALLPLPRGGGQVSYDPMRAEVTFDAVHAPGATWLAATRRRASDAQLIAAVEVESPERFVVRLSSLRSSAVLIQTPFRDDGYLVVGRYRVVPNPRRTFFRSDCAQTLWAPLSEAVADGIDAYCTFGEGDGLATIELESAIDSSERQVVTVLRHELEADREGYTAGRFTRIAEGGVGADARFAAWTAVALHAAMRDELPGALDALSEARGELAGVPAERGSAAEAQVDRFGSAVYERLIRGALAAGAPIAAVFYAERYQQWERGPFDSEVKWDLARAYRLLELPESAAQLYVEVLAGGVEDQVAVLHELTRSYLEAGDRFRAFETLEFLREQAGANGVDARLSAEVARLGTEPTVALSPCVAAPQEPTGADLLRLHACARRAENWEEATAIAEQFTSWAQTAEDPLADPRLGRLLEAEAARAQEVNMDTNTDM